MPLQNRVDPFGDILQVPERGTLMGNRGILHDETGRIHRKHAHQNWVSCTLDYKGKTQTLMKPGRYTQLFFLDEATSLAAGHRPCATCRRERYKSFIATWCEVHGRPEAGKSVPQTIDRMLHASRISLGKKITFRARLTDLLNGTIFEEKGQPILVWNGSLFLWNFGGYQAIDHSPFDEVSVLTPKPIFDMFVAGWLPSVRL